MTGDPIARFRSWWRAAGRAAAPPRDAVALATATRSGRPSLRYVLLKGADSRGFVFFSDARSRKGRELAANPQAALAFYWERLGRQVRVEGRVERLAPEEAEAYWVTRPRGSQLSAAASRQSARLGSRRALAARRQALARRLAGGPVPRPAAWTGFLLVPRALEFWTDRPDRLHHRERFVRTSRGWQRVLLQP